MVCCLNIASLTYGVASTSTFIGPSQKRKRTKDKQSPKRIYSPSSQNIEAVSAFVSFGETLIFFFIFCSHFQKKSAQKKRLKAAVLISLSWFFPLLYCVLVSWRLNCLYYCKCLPGYYKRLDCQSGIQSQCGKNSQEYLYIQIQLCRYAHGYGYL